MSTIGKRTIYRGPADSSDHKPLSIEGVCLTASLLPGAVIEQVAAGLQSNTAAATVFGQELLVANKNELQSKSVDDAWTQNENMVGIRLRSGEFANILVAPSQNITARGTPLSLNGSGLLQIASTDGTQQILCYSDEIINTTGGPASGTLVSVRVA